MGPASGNQSGSKSASVHRGSSGSPVRTLSPVVPTSEKAVCIYREGTGPSSSHTSVPTTVSLLTASSDNTSPTDASALCAAAPSVPLQDKQLLLLTLLILPVNLHLHLSLHRPLGVKFARDLHLIMAINCVTYNCRGWNSGCVTISDFID